MLANRLRKRFGQLHKWAKKNNITCFRLYERDIPEFPLIVDWYAGFAVVWVYARKVDETEAQKTAFRDLCLEAIAVGLAVGYDKIVLKSRIKDEPDTPEDMASEGLISTVTEQGLRFEVNLSDYLDTGLFLDHRNTRLMVEKQAAGKAVLNLFAYTGSFTCYALAGGAASTTTVDISKTYCAWAKRNLQLNGFVENLQNQIVNQDCFVFLQEAMQQKRRYDLIICDPPTFSNSKKMQKTYFDINKDYPVLLQQCLALLKPSGKLIFSTNSRKFELDTANFAENLTFKEISSKTVPLDFRNKKIHRCWEIYK